VASFAELFRKVKGLQQEFPTPLVGNFSLHEKSPPEGGVFRLARKQQVIRPCRKNRFGGSVLGASPSCRSARR
jgi:hypothetical protein